ncbi:52 kDa repressor of the inhibitor of the protein kinase-like [Littorina saxatilis]|uniref:52 kDa repressor of the inhibitor of the protein kinase-like n=1 Tax=Littorina saxatilis TaxID=31220 RepID=UPI0038B5493B
MVQENTGTTSSQPSTAGFKNQHGWQQQPTQLHKPRGAERQTCRSNPPAETTEDFFRRSIAIPFLDHLIAQLDSRFTTGSEIAVDGMGLVPSCIVAEGRIEPVPEGIQRLASLWEADLPSFEALDTEYVRWRHKWEGAAADAPVPDTVAEALRSCPEDFFPNIHRMLILLSTLPITTVECERTISGIRTLKSYLRTTMGETRLNGLALMRTHRHITVDIDDVVDRFANRYRTAMALQPRRLLNS